MTKINIITFPDKLFNDSETLLLIYPREDLQKELTEKVLNHIDSDLNIYMFNETSVTGNHIDWLLTVFHMVDSVIIDIDNVPSSVKDLLAYFVAKTKTYWLTNADESVYNHISNNRIYNLDNFNIGVISVENEKP